MIQKDPIRIAEGFAADLKTVFGKDLQAVLLVGSAARGDFIPGKSDVNTLVILSPAGMESLEQVNPILLRWRRQNVAVPHFMTLDSLRRSLDSYPLEILDFKSFHRVIQGPDPLIEFIIPHPALRLQIEREARGKLLLLQQALALHAKHEKDLAEVLKRSLPAFSAIFQGILELRKLPIPAVRVHLFIQAAPIVGFGADVFQTIVQLRAGGGPKPGSGEIRALFKGLLREVEHLVAWVDSYRVV